MVTTHRHFPSIGNGLGNAKDRNSAIIVPCSDVGVTILTLATIGLVSGIFHSNSSSNHQLTLVIIVTLVTMEIAMKCS